MTIQYDNLNSTISAVGSATNIPVNIQPKGTGGLNVLGSGQNLFTQSSTFSTWGVNSATLTLSTATTDPFGGTSVYKLVANNGFDPTTGSNANISNSGTTLPLGVVVTQSIYFKAAEFSALRIRNNSSGELYTFTIGVTPTPTSGVLTPALTLIDNGWYRVSWSFSTGSIGSTSRSDNWSFRIANTGDGTSGIYVSSPQLEFGSVLNTYIPTTTTAIYGTPTLTFSGVAGLGLQSDGSLYVQPAGTGALQAQPTTSSTVGGNARGANAVDWQTTRNNATQVASGSFCVIGGGSNNQVNAFAGIVAGGSSNRVTGNYNAVLGGTTNIADSGFRNSWSVIVGGNTNTASGHYNFIGGGFTNSGTSSSAVTTQATTTVTSGSTAVTLTGSNANIKVGQLIAGTGINEFPGTYVSAISGTSLTLSQNASATGTPTLSFFTPHGVVVGGGNNQATGSYSFIGGGGDAGTSANRNSVAGDWSAVVGGSTNSIASAATYSFIGGGSGNVVSTAPYASVVGGNLNNATQFAAVVGGGVANTANSSYSSILGGYQGTTRSIGAYTVFPACAAPIAFSAGVSQAALLILGRQTTDATATVLTSNNVAASTTNQVILPNNSAYFFRGEVISGVTGGGDTKGWTIEGVIKRGANAASTALVGTPTVTSSFADAGASTWTIAVTADTTNGGLRITFTGQAATTIRTVAQIRTTEMTY